MDYEMLRGKILKILNDQIGGLYLMKPQTEKQYKRIQICLANGIMEIIRKDRQPTTIEFMGRPLEYWETLDRNAENLKLASLVNEIVILVRKIARYESKIEELHKLMLDHEDNKDSLKSNKHNML